MQNLHQIAIKYLTYPIQTNPRRPPPLDVEHRVSSSKLHVPTFQEGGSTLTVSLGQTRTWYRRTGSHSRRGTKNP